MWGYGGYYGKGKVRLIPDNRAQAGVAIGIVILLACLAIGGLIFATISKETKSVVEEEYGNGSEVYQTYTSMEQTGWSALKFLAFATFVSAAVVIITLLRKASG